MQVLHCIRLIVAQWCHIALENLVNIGCHLADDTFKRIFLNENVRILIKISLKFVAKGPLNNTPTLVQIMAWRRPGNKPLSEPMVVWLPTHICVTWLQWLHLNAFSVWMTMITNIHFKWLSYTGTNVLTLERPEQKWVINGLQQKSHVQHIIFSFEASGILVTALFSFSDSVGEWWSSFESVHLHLLQWDRLWWIWKTVQL